MFVVAVTYRAEVQTVGHRTNERKRRKWHGIHYHNLGRDLLSLCTHVLPKSGIRTLTVFKDQEKECGLCAKLMLACSTCNLRKERPSQRVSGDAKITPFDMNVHTMKGIQSSGKRVTAATDFWLR